MSENLECPCPPRGTIDVVGKKWAICVVTLLGRNGVLRFGLIERTLSRVSPATLVSTLRSLERAGLVSHESGSPGYALTSRGQALYRNLLPLADWLRSA